MYAWVLQPLPAAARLNDTRELAHLIADVLDAPNDEAALKAVAEKVQALCARRPVYGA